MSNPQFAQHWHGMPRDQITWHAVVNPDVCPAFPWMARQTEGCQWCRR